MALSIFDTGHGWSLSPSEVICAVKTECRGIYSVVAY